MELRDDDSLWDDADDPIDDVALFEEQQGWEGADLKPLGRVGMLIDVERADDELAGMRGRDHLDHRGDHVTWATPIRPEIDEHQLFSPEDLGLEIVVC
jgi:hypothetical protein